MNPFQRLSNRKAPPRQSRYLTPAQVQRVFSWSRFLIVVMLLLTQLLTLLGLLWVNKTSSERALRTQVHTSLTHLVRVTAETTRAYLHGPAEVVELQRAGMSSGQMNFGTAPQQMAGLNGVLNAVREVDGAMTGRPDGRFVFVQRGATTPGQPPQAPGESGGQGDHSALRFVLSVNTQPVRRVTQGHITAQGQLLNMTEVSNPYDPRQRPWYKQAMQSPGQTVWTAPYIFAASRKPGITVSSTVQAPNQPISAVVAMDVRLDGLAGLLQNLQISPNGRAFIADTQGHAVATSRAWPGDLENRVPLLREISDPPLQALLAGQDALPGQGQEKLRMYSVGKVRYAAVLRDVQVTPEMRWLIGVYAPEADFNAELQEASRKQLWAILLFTLFSVLVAWPLAFRATRPLANLQRQATTDALTGLANRASLLALLHEELRQVKLSNNELAVVLLDLDGFKAINDQYGHRVGDEVLLAVAARLLGSVRPGDMLGRLGGDEFALILKGGTRERIRLRIESIIQELSLRPLEVEGRQFSLGATAGLAFNEPALHREDDELLDAADQALMRGKRLEKGRVWAEGEGRNTVFQD